MTTPKDSMVDIEKEINSKSRLFPVLLWLFIAYILLVILISVKRFHATERVTSFDIVLPLVLILIPTLGATLFKLKTKLGYIICLFYYQLMTLTFTAVIAQRIYEDRRFRLDIASNWGQYGILALSIPISILILTKDIHAYFNISKKLLRWTVFISIFLVLSFIIVLLTN